MLVINQRKKLFIKMETVYFAEDYSKYQSKADIVLFYLSRRGIPGARHFHTQRIDLYRSEEELFRDLNRTTQRAIRQINQEGGCRLDISDSPTPEEIRRFCESYDVFARTKGIKTADREFLLMAGERGALCLSAVCDESGNDLCGGADIHDGQTVLGMYAYSHFRKYREPAVRNRISNANRYLNWEMFRYYRQKGFTVMDMGGLGMGEETEDLNSVDSFKLNFGGRVETLYHFYLPKSPLGKLAVWLTRKNTKIEY